MQVEELVTFLEWVHEEIEGPNLLSLYKALQNILTQNAQPNQGKQPLEQQRNALTEGVMAPDLQRLNDSQIRFAGEIGLLDVVGERARDGIEDVLYKNVIDVATSAQKIQEMREHLASIIQNLTKVREGLSVYVEAAPPEYEEALIRVVFQHDASIRNIVDLKKWSAAWFDIARGVAMANQAAPEEVRVIGASRGSVIYELAVSYGVAQLLTGIILLVLKVADRVLELRRKAEELRGMKLSNDKAVKELEKEAEKVEEEGRKSVMDEVRTRRTLDGEHENALSRNRKGI